MGLGAWIPDLGEDTRSGEKADMRGGCTQAGFDEYSAPLVGLRGSRGDMQWELKREEGLLGKEACLEKDWVDIRSLAWGAPLGRVLRGSLSGLKMKRDESSW